ncbi:MAG: hypothetical protein K8Q88_04995 [Nitrosarchaeum sp.]|nr:hypothetical protein [Nitrosarchaeum sp.]
MTIDEAKKSNVSMNAILDDLTVIELSVEMLEIYYKQHMDEEAKQYFKNIKNHCNNIVKTITENNKTTKKN